MIFQYRQLWCDLTDYLFNYFPGQNPIWGLIHQTTFKSKNCDKKKATRVKWICSDKQRCQTVVKNCFHPKTEITFHLAACSSSGFSSESSFWTNLCQVSLFSRTAFVAQWLQLSLSSESPWVCFPTGSGLYLQSSLQLVKNICSSMQSSIRFKFDIAQGLKFQQK